MKLPKTITLRLTKTALDAVPDEYPGLNRKKEYNMNRCLICQAIRERFPDVKTVSVLPGDVWIEDQYTFSYPMALEKQIKRAHRFPRTFKPFSIKLTRV